MKKMIKLSFVVLVAVIITAGCGGQVNSERNGAAASDSRQDYNESNLSPTKDPKKETKTVKRMVTFYFVDKELLEMHKVEKEIEAKTEEDLLKAALEIWIKGPDNEELTNLVPPGTIIEYAKEVNGVAHISFSREIKNANLGSSGEDFLLNQLALITKQFGYESTQILVEGQKEESLLGHIYTLDPIKAREPK